MDVIYLIPIGIIGIVRWVSWLLRRIPAVLYRPISTGHRESLAIVVPVYQEDPEMFIRALESWLANDVDEIILVIDRTDEICLEIARSYPPPVHVIVTDVPGKRDALRKGWMAARSSLVALVDSDTMWAGDVAALVCEPFADPTIGGVGTRQNVYNPHGLWQRIADLYLDYRYFDEIAGQTVMGRAVSCLSGRTAVYRRELLVRHTERFMSETFMGVQCMSGDDKRLTCLTLEAGYRTFLQRPARVWSVFPDKGRRFFRQRTRWARNTWRSDLRALSSRWVWHHRFLAFCMLDKAVASPCLLLSASFMIFALVNRQWLVAGILGAWWFLSRSVKMLPHLERRPRDLLLMPAFILVSIGMAVVKMWALLTVRKQLWLTRDVAVVDGEIVRTGAMGDHALAAAAAEAAAAAAPAPAPIPMPVTVQAVTGANGHGSNGSRPAAPVSAPVPNGHRPMGAGPGDGERWGPGRRGRRKVTTSGPTTVSLSAYPCEADPGEEVLVDVEVGFAGGVKSICIDYGDGASLDAVRRPEWYCNGVTAPKDTVVGGLHAYTEAGSYRLTAVVTTVDCSGKGMPRLPAGWHRPTRRDGSPARPDPLFPSVEPAGDERVTVVTLTVTARPHAASGPVPTRPEPDLADRR